MLGGDGANFGGGFGEKRVGESGAAGDGGNAALGFETGGGDAAVIEADGEAEDVSADRICHFNRRGGVGQVAGVVWGAKVVEDNFVEHCTWCCRQAPTYCKN